MENLNIEKMKDYQQQLFPYAYNILGSSEDARDAIQDVISRYIATPEKNIDNETGYLVKSVINQSINIKNRKKKIIGDKTWLPEPVSTESADTAIQRDEILSYSLLVLLEHLRPRERAVFILKEAFDYSHEEIADTLSVTVENSRQLLSRAKSELKIHREKMPVQAGNAPGYLEKYLSVIRDGDLKTLEKLLSEDISAVADGGGRVRVASELEKGLPDVSRFILFVFENYQKPLRPEITVINHEPAILFWLDNTLIACQVFELDENREKIMNIYSVVDPEKLKYIFSA